jgi:GT2 family glycosyltransferase
MIGAVIPTRFDPPELPYLLDVLTEDKVLWIIQPSEQFGHRIHRMWNDGLDRLADCDYVAMLNDDIRILPGTLPFMARVLDKHLEVGIVYPDIRVPFASLPTEVRLEETEGSWGRGGMTGFCFMFRPGPKFDESYQWWYGDDDFEERMRLSGKKVCRVVGLPIVHTVDGSAHKVWNEIEPLTIADRNLWEARHR